MADNPRKGSNALHHDIVKRVVTDPQNFGGAVVLSGYVGPSTEAGKLRVYSDLSFSNYTDIPETDVLHSELTSDDPLAARIIWAKPSLDTIRLHPSWIDACPTRAWDCEPVFTRAPGCIPNPITRACSWVCGGIGGQIDPGPLRAGNIAGGGMEAAAPMAMNAAALNQPINAVNTLRCGPISDFVACNTTLTAGCFPTIPLHGCPPRTPFFGCPPTPPVICVHPTPPVVCPLPTQPSACCVTPFPNCPVSLTWICNHPITSPVICQPVQSHVVCPTSPLICPQVTHDLACPQVTLAGCPSLGACPSIACGLPGLG